MRRWSARHVRQDAIPRVEKSKGREGGRHTFVACVLNEWVCWREQWNGWNERSGGRRGKDEKTRGLCNGRIQRPIKIKQLPCILVTFQERGGVVRPEARLPKHAPRIRAGDSKHSHSHAASARDADPGTSLFPLSFLSHLLILWVKNAFY